MKKTNKKIQFFSLIELLIVIGIMGALTALILPQFNNAEENAKDTGCDYNNSGTLRYVTMFKAVNGVYPNGFHTGYGAGGTKLSADQSVDCTAGNMGASTALSAGQVESLKNAGITQLAYGTSQASAISTSSQVCTITASSTTWSEDTSYDGTRPDPVTNEVLIKGNTIPSYAETVVADTSGSVIVPLFAAPTVDWETTADGEESAVSVALEGKCPWPADGKLRYYICFFKVYEDGTAAKLIGTACPECGSLNASAF